MTSFGIALRLAILIGSAMAPFPVSAQNHAVALDQAVDGSPGTTYVDLLRLIAPDLALENGAYRTRALASLRHIDGEPGSPENGPVHVVGDVEMLPAATGGEERLLVLLDLGWSAEQAEGLAVLALFDLRGRPRLLDAVNVSYDRRTGFFGPGKLAVGSGEDMVLTASRHFNSSEDHQTTVLVTLRGDRLRLVDTINTVSYRACGFTRSQQVEVSALGPSVRASVTDEITPAEPACRGASPPAASRRVVSVTYRWQAASGVYGRDSDALDRLAEDR